MHTEKEAEVGADEGKKCKRAKIDAWQGRGVTAPLAPFGPLNDVRYVRIIDF